MTSNIRQYEEDMSDLVAYRKLGTIEELSKRVNEEDILKFYYCESEDLYLVGQRHDTMYYGKVDKSGITFFMSRYLPWGKRIEDENSIWNGYTYPSEPKEISFVEWLTGYMKQIAIVEFADDIDEELLINGKSVCSHKHLYPSDILTALDEYGIIKFKEKGE